MLPEAHRSQRVITVIAIGGASIAAVALYYFIVKKKSIQTDPQDSVSSDMSRVDSDLAVEDSSTPITSVPQIKPSNFSESKVPDETSHELEERVESLTICSEECTLPMRELTSIDILIKDQEPIVDWAACCSAEEKPATPSLTIPKNKKVVTLTSKNLLPAPSNTGVSTETTSPNSRNYKMADSPSVDSTHSESLQMSNDSGRATVMAPAAYTPFDTDGSILPMYEFEVPNTLVGLIIGIGGKTIKELCNRADVRILIRPHYDQSKLQTHQICSIEGKRGDINKCLHMMRHRFPSDRFPNLNLKPVFPPPIQPPMVQSCDLMQLSIPAGVMCEVYISAPIDAGHFFVQLPTHPTFSSLGIIDEIMNSTYNRSIGLPEYARPPKNSVNTVCAAPAANGWYRAVSLYYDEQQDEMLMKFVDYGGFARMPRADLRFLRHDLLSLPFQSIECRLAFVDPINGSTWSEEANNFFQKLCTSKIIQLSLIGHARSDGLPYVRLYITTHKKKVVRFDRILIKKGYAKEWDAGTCNPLPFQPASLPVDERAEAECDINSFDEPTRDALNSHSNRRNDGSKKRSERSKKSVSQSHSILTR